MAYFCNFKRTTVYTFIRFSGQTIVSPCYNTQSELLFGNTAGDGTFMRKIPKDMSGNIISKLLRPRRPGTRNPKDKSRARGSQGERDGQFEMFFLWIFKCSGVGFVSFFFLL